MLREQMIVMRSMVVGLLLAVLVLAGCGGGEAAAPTDVAEQPAATATEREAEPSPTTRARTTPAARTDTPEDSEEEATPPGAGDIPGTTGGVGEQTNQAGFAFATPDGWETISNDALPGIGGIALLAPAGTDPNNPQESIILNVGQSLFFITDTLEADTTPDELLDILSRTAGEGNATLTEREDVEIGGVEGRVANIGDAESEGRVAVARVDEDRWFLMLGVATQGAWEPDTFDEVLASVEFTTPMQDDLEMELPDIMATMMPTVTMEGMPTIEIAPETGTPESGEDATDTGTDAGTPESSIFPLPEDAADFIDLGSNQEVNYQTALTLEEVMQFYRDAFTAAGATERSILTVTSENTFNLVFDGWPDAGGRAVVIQGVELSPESVNVNIRLEDV